MAVATTKEDRKNKVGFIQLWDPATGKELRTIEIPGGGSSILGLVFSPDSTMLAASVFSGTIAVVDLATGEVRPWKVNPRSAPLLLFGRDSSKFYSCENYSETIY